MGHMHKHDPYSLTSDQQHTVQCHDLGVTSGPSVSKKMNTLSNYPQVVTTTLVLDQGYSADSLCQVKITAHPQS